MNLRVKTTLILIALILLSGLALQPTSAQGPVVQAVLFYSPTCPHCHDIMDNFLPPLQTQYGSQLEILEVDVTTVAGQTLYQQAIQTYQIPQNRLGVPTMILAGDVMVGSFEITERLPVWVETGIAGDGFAYPNIPGLAEAVDSQTFSIFGAAGNSSGSSIIERFNQDPLANSLAAVVLIGMVYSLITMLSLYYRSGRKTTPHIPEWVIPVIALVGLAVSVYLSVIEVNAAEAFCGPVGDCNAVQQSSYAWLFGVIPVGVLGIGAYLFILGAWVVQRSSREDLRLPAIQTMWLVAVVGTLFSIYLTYLEPFVIGATCMWCITSAVAMTALLWITTYQSIDARSPKTRRRAR